MGKGHKNLCERKGKWLSIESVFIYVHVFVNVWYMCASAGEVQKRVWDPLGLELQRTMNHLMWVVRIEMGSFKEQQVPLTLCHLSYPHKSNILEGDEFLLQ